jgi:hypothetical protein
MSNLLIGSSNVDRFYKATLFPNFRQYKMVKCTQMSGFSAYMNTLEARSKCVLISVIENFIVDAVGADITEPENAINKCINDFLLIVQTTVIKYPKVKFGVVMPLRRPSLLWYQERVDLITKFLCDGVKELISVKSVNNVVTVCCPLETSQQFDSDLVHLTKPSAKIFLETILESAEKFFEAEMVDLTGVQDSDSDTIKNLEDRLARLEKSMLDQANKNIANDLMFARSREETDSVTNRIKEDRLVMNGLKSSIPLPSDQRNKIEALKKIALEIFVILIPDFQGKIIYLSQGKNAGEPVPMVEVRLEKTEDALAIRKAYAEKKKNKLLSRELDTLFISNSVSLATRVRVDVMKAIARKVSNKDDLAYVAGFTSRPMMHIRRAGPPSPSTRPLKSFSYIDTVTRFGHLVDVEDLETAYGRAGRSFNGQLQQNFVVLNERDQASLQSVLGARGPAPGTSFRPGGARGGGAAKGGSGSARGRGEKRPGDPFENSTSKK